MPRLHIINPFTTASGGSEARALSLARLLAPHAEVTLWATSAPDPALAQSHPIRIIDPVRLRFPRRGTFIFVGVYYWLTSWIRLTRPDRQIVLYNTMKLEDLHQFLQRLGARPPPELVYASAEARDAAGLPGRVEASPINIELFQPRRPTPRPFTVGRHSRDTRYKFHPDDPAFFRHLAESKARVRIMGGTCLAEELGVAPGVELLPACTEPAPDFLASLDCFYYRTDPSWHEAFGRVVFEAMACAVPPVCGAEGGYARFIRHGENGFLFRTEAEAEGQIATLRNNPDRAAAMGRAARATVESMYGDAYEQALLDYYLSPALRKD